jgi:phospholipid N-methyltransferase
MNNSRLLFWRRYMHRPLGVGGVAPSGSSLARAMVETLAPSDEEVIVEIGPGTGPFTRALLAAGVAPSRLILVEFDPEFVRHLRQRFPGVTVLQGDAAQLPQLLKEQGHDKVPKILSGLPLRSMPEGVRIAISRDIARRARLAGAVQLLHRPALGGSGSESLRPHRAAGENRDGQYPAGFRLALQQGCRLTVSPGSITRRHCRIDLDKCR